MSLSITAKRTMVASLLARVGQAAEAESLFSQPFTYVTGANFSQKHLLYFSFGDEKFRADVSKIDAGLLELGRFDQATFSWVDCHSASDRMCLDLFEAAAEEFGDWLFGLVDEAA